MKRTRDRYQKVSDPAHNHNVMTSGLNIPAGIFKGIVVNNEDPDRLGRVKVHISGLTSAIMPIDADGATLVEESDEGYLGAIWCLRLLPIGGVSQAGAGPSAHGIWGPPPDINTEVLVSFGPDSDKPIILGVIPDLDRIQNLTGPQSVVNETGTKGPSYDSDRSKTTETEPPKEHPLAERLRQQGLDSDILRGDNYSSPTRDPASRVFGMSTPFGHSIVMDDGDFETDEGNVVRIRTSSGSQFLLDDTHGSIYMINRDGTGWFEINRNGDFDMYLAGAFNVNAEKGFNIHSASGFNMQSDSGISLVSPTGINLYASGGPVNIASSGDINLSADGNGNISANGGLKMSAARIDLNGPAADKATTPPKVPLVGNNGVVESAASRVPEKEPWSGHLDVRRRSPTTSPIAASARRSGSTYYGGLGNPNSAANQTGAAVLGPISGAEVKSGGLVNWGNIRKDHLVPEIVAITEAVATEFGRTIRITSGYRDRETNVRAGGAKYSQHINRRAVDISGSGLSNSDRLKLIAIASKYGAIGIGIYSGGSLHFDNRQDDREGWGSSFSYDSVPAYAKATIDKHIAGGYYNQKAFEKALEGIILPSKQAVGDTGPVSLGATAQARKAALDNDPEFQAYLNSMLAKYPGLEKDDVYGIMYGESTFDPRKIAAANGKYGGLFQLGQESVGLDPNYVARLAPVEQLALYDQYLSSPSRANYKGGGLGMYQAAPGVIQNYYKKTGDLPPDNLVLYVRDDAHRRLLNSKGYNANFASTQFGNAVYNQNSEGGKYVTELGTGWVNNDDAITAGSVNTYYRKYDEN